jgi:antitoxin component YwqK of YwqJK toxin-antitoxin module
MNKIKLFSVIILIEILIINTLLIVFLFNWKILSPDTYKISPTSSDLIYSRDKSMPFTGKMQDTLDNKLIAEFEVVDGFKQGEFILFTFDGNYAVKGFMNKNKNDGTWKYFYDDGKLECTGDFNNDEAVGKWTWFYNSGSVKSEGTFINGKPDGRWLKYNPEGVPIIIINYTKGEVISLIQLDQLVKV